MVMQLVFGGENKRLKALKLEGAILGMKNSLLEL
jgi:hypothetical protein